MLSSCSRPIRLAFFLVVYCLIFTIGVAAQDAIEEPPYLRLVDLGKTYERNPGVTPGYLYFADSDRGGSTSVRRTDAPNLKWKSQGYYQRNRDLGQIFNVKAGDTVTLDAIVLRTGNSASAVLPGTPGAEVYLQIFEVLGTPEINDNMTPKGTASTHGFSDVHRTDDYLEGVSYRSLFVASGGLFPDLPPTTTGGGEPGHLRFLRWDLLGEAELTLHGGKRYAFMVGFSEPGPERGFSLGNNNLAASDADPILRSDANGMSWWSIRREGDGTLPPTQYPSEEPPKNSFRRDSLLLESQFVVDHQLSLAPTTDGFPDVDTYRTVEFYIETK